MGLLKVTPCSCGQRCDDYDPRNPTCEGKVLAYGDPDLPEYDALNVRHECEAHYWPPVCERVSREARP